MALTSMGIHPHHRFEDKENTTEFAKDGTHHGSNQGTNWLRLNVNDNEVTVFLDSLSTKEVDTFTDQMEQTAHDMRQWNDERKADENEDVAS